MIILSTKADIVHTGIEASALPIDVVIRLRQSLCAYMCMCVDAHVYSYMCIRLSMCVSVCIWVSMYVFMFLLVCICVL